MDKFGEMVYAPGSAASKSSRARLWQSTADILHIAPFPLTPEKVLQFAAILKEAGYRSGFLYIVEIEQVHVRMGYPLDHPLRLAVADARRGLERGIGAPARSAELRPGWLDELHAAVDKGDVVLERGNSSPRGGLHVWGVGMGWLLRELELAMLNVHADTLRVNEVEGTVTIKVSSSKTDPAGRSASRTHRCRCSGRKLPSCPVCSSQILLKLAMESWGGDRSSEKAKLVPLIGTVANPLAYVAKSALVHAAQCDAASIKELGIAEVASAEVTGHFMRRSGAKELARRGVSLARIQWLGRWGSAAVLSYVEEAAEEAPDFHDQSSKDGQLLWDGVKSDLACVLRAASPGGDRLQDVLDRPAVRAECAQSGMTEARLMALERFAAEAKTELGDTSALALELDHLVRPTFVVNRTSRVLHRAFRTERLDPVMASTVCGWKWARSPLSQPVGAEDVARAGPLWTECAKCTGAAQEGGG